MDQIAIGVGVGLGVPLILIAALAWLRPTIMRRFVNKASPRIAVVSDPNSELPGNPVVEVPAGQVAAQLPVNERPVELST